MREIVMAASRIILETWAHLENQISDQAVPGAAGIFALGSKMSISHLVYFVFELEDFLNFVDEINAVTSEFRGLIVPVDEGWLLRG